MHISAPLSSFFLSAALMAQAPAPTQPLGERVKAERPVIEQLLAELKHPEALKRAEALLPATKPTFDKTSNQTMVQSCSAFMDVTAAHRLAVETADAAGAWEKALDYAKSAKALATECYEGLKEPFTNTVAHYTQSGIRAKEVLVENDARIQELKAKTSRDPGEQQELDLALGVEKEVGESAKWVKFFQTYLDVAKLESESYDPLVKVMENKLKSEADQVEAYKPGKGDRLKWVNAVISSPTYLEAQGDKAGKARWLYRLATLDPSNKKVQAQLDTLTGRKSAPKGKPKKA